MKNQTGKKVCTFIQHRRPTTVESKRENTKKEVWYGEIAFFAKYKLNRIETARAHRQHALEEEVIGKVAV